MCGPSSGWSKCALLLLFIAVSIHIAGWATTHWMVYSTTNKVVSTNIGLWQMESCNSGTCEDTSVASQYETDSFNCVRAMETITFCLAVLTVILLIIYTCAQMDQRQTFAAVIMIILYVAGCCSFIGMVVFITAIPDPFEVSWSMGLTVIAMTLILISGTLMIPDAFEPDYGDSSGLDYDDDYYSLGKRNTVTPVSGHANEGPRGITPIYYTGAQSGQRW